MTNEKAREVLQEQIDRYGQEYDAEGIEALEIAIKALEQQPHQAEFVPSRDGYDGHVTCTNCFKIYDWDSEAQYFSYCPNCGAKMAEEEKPIKAKKAIDIMHDVINAENIPYEGTDDR